MEWVFTVILVLQAHVVSQDGNKDDFSALRTYKCLRLHQTEGVAPIGF
jgi:hypothetical protein